MSKQEIENAKIASALVASESLLKETKQLSILLGTNKLLDSSTDFLEATKNLSAKTFAENFIIPEINGFIKAHLNTAASREDVNKFFTKILETLAANSQISRDDAGNYNKAEEVETITIKKRFILPDKKIVTKTLDISKFDKLVNSTHDLIKDITPNLKTTEKLWFNLSNLFDLVGLDSLSKVCKNQISFKNLEALNDINTKISTELQKMSKEISPENKTLPKIGEHTAKILAERSNPASKNLIR